MTCLHSTHSPTSTLLCTTTTTGELLMHACQLQCIGKHYCTSCIHNVMQHHSQLGAWFRKPRKCCCNVEFTYLCMLANYNEHIVHLVRNYVMQHQLGAWFRKPWKCYCVQCASLRAQPTCPTVSLVVCACIVTLQCECKHKQRAFCFEVQLIAN